MIDKRNVPRHIAIIMDGNGRWAKINGLPKIEGHRAGANVVEEIIQGCIEWEVEILSLYTFSTENWQRPKREVNALMGLLGQHLKKNSNKLKENKIKFMVSGKKDDLPRNLQQQIQELMMQTKDNAKLVLNLALNYGGRQDILQAAKSIALKVKQEQLGLSEINEQLFTQHLYTNGLPDPDLLIRTSGERRISNFFLWQLSYSEFYFTSKLWPDFKKQDLTEAILEYQKRQRRFGA